MQLIFLLLQFYLILFIFLSSIFYFIFPSFLQFYILISNHFSGIFALLSFRYIVYFKRILNFFCKHTCIPKKIVLLLSHDY